jgi:putative aldouronate transport system permease protein
MLALVLPGLVYFIVFHYIALLGNVIAFLDYQPFLGFFDSPWVGLANFQSMVVDARFWQAVRNTIVIFSLQLLLFFPAPIALALLLNSLVSVRTRRVIQSIVYLPHFISWVIIVILFEQVLGGAGVVARLWLEARALGLCPECPPVNITATPGTFPLLITAQTIWREAGWGTIIYLAALLGIDPALYEAAAVDGASRWRRLWHVTIPGIMGITIVLLILRLGTLLSVGFEPVLLQRNAVGANASEVLDTYVYFNGIAAGEWGVSAAAGLVKGIIGTALVIGANRIAHAFGQSGLYR